MASAKTLYWATLGVLAATFAWSHTGQRLADRASVVTDQICAKSSQYAAIAEMAFGHTQSGYGRMQAATTRFAAEQARMQAERARMQAETVREQMDELMATKQMWQAGRTVQIKKVLRESQVDGESFCPRTRVHIAIPDAQALDLTSTNDPI
jgi:hypothetical protein